MNKKIILLSVTAMANVGLALWAIAPFFITYADLAPYGDQCECQKPKAQAALINFGRAEVLYNTKQSIVSIVLLAASNFAVLSYVVVRAKP